MGDFGACRRCVGAGAGRRGGVGARNSSLCGLHAGMVLCVRAHIRMRVRTHTHTYTISYIHAYIHTRTHTHTRAHTYADATPTRPKPSALGGTHLTAPKAAERPGTVPLPADGSKPRRRQSRGLSVALPQVDESLLRMEPVALVEATAVSTAAAAYEQDVVAERRMRKTSRTISKGPGLAVAAAHV